MTAGWSATSFTSSALTQMTVASAGFPPGYALVTVFTNGIPSTSRLILVGPLSLTVNPVTPAAICSGATTNIALSSVPAGASFSWTIGTVTGTVTGQAAGAGSTIVQTLTGGGTVTYIVTPTLSGNPGTPLNIVQTVNAPPTAANAGPDQTVGGTTATLAANTPSAGTGAWSVVSGPSTLLSQFSSTSSPTATFTPAGGTGYYFLRWTISNAPCAVSADEVLITVANPPTIAKAFSPATITVGGVSTVNIKLTNPNAIGPVAGFTDMLTNMNAVGGGIGGTCGTVAPIVLPANATSLNFNGIALPVSGSCVVSFLVRSTIVGVHTNATSGVTTDLTAAAGAPSNTATLTVNSPTMPTVLKAFSRATITAGGNSTVTLTLNNSGSSLGVIAAFTDTLANMVAVGGPIGGTCATLSSVAIPANATALSFSDIVLPGNGSCVVSFDIRSNVPGVHPNTTSGVTTDQSSVAGPVSNTANLTVNAPTMTTIAKAFSPTAIASGGTSTVTLTLSNSLPFGVLGSFTDTLTNMTAVGGPSGTTCASLAAITIPVNATNLNFSGLVIPGNGSCQVSFAVTSNVVGAHPNTTSGITTDQSPLAGPVSNTAILTVTAPSLPRLARKTVRHDFDGDRKSDLAEWRAELGAWQVRFSSDSELHRIQLIEPNDQAEYWPVAADFDGDGQTDAALWRAQDGHWLIKRSSDGELVKAQFGSPDDQPMAADFDGDGKADLAVWRNQEAGLHIQRSSDQTEQVIYLGQAGDVPVLGDYDGDGLTDFAVFRAGLWLIRLTATGMLSDARFGQPGDEPLAADCDGDGKDELIGWRPAEGAAYVRHNVTGEVERAAWGRLQPNERIVLGDYDGDGRAEPRVYSTLMRGSSRR